MSAPLTQTHRMRLLPAGQNPDGTWSMVEVGEDGLVPASGPVTRMYAGRPLDDDLLDPLQLTVLLVEVEEQRWGEKIVFKVISLCPIPNMEEVVSIPAYWHPDGLTAKHVRRAVEESGGDFVKDFSYVFQKAAAYEDRIPVEFFLEDSVFKRMAEFLSNKHEHLLDVALDFVLGYNQPVQHDFGVYADNPCSSTKLSQMTGVRACLHLIMRVSSWENVSKMETRNILEFMHVAGGAEAKPEAILQHLLALKCGGPLLLSSGLALKRLLIQCDYSEIPDDAIIAQRAAAHVQEIHGDKFKIYWNYLGHYTYEACPKLGENVVFDPDAAVSGSKLFSIDDDGMVSTDDFAKKRIFLNERVSVQTFSHVLQEHQFYSQASKEEQTALVAVNPDAAKYTGFFNPDSIAIIRAQGQRGSTSPKPYASYGLDKKVTKNHNKIVIWSGAFFMDLPEVVRNLLEEYSWVESVVLCGPAVSPREIDGVNWVHVLSKDKGETTKPPYLEGWQYTGNFEAKKFKENFIGTQKNWEIKMYTQDILECIGATTRKPNIAERPFEPIGCSVSHLAGRAVFEVYCDQVQGNSANGAMLSALLSPCDPSAQILRDVLQNKKKKGLLTKFGKNDAMGRLDSQTKNGRGELVSTLQSDGSLRSRKLKPGEKKTVSQKTTKPVTGSCFALGLFAHPKGMMPKPYLGTTFLINNKEMEALSKAFVELAAYFSRRVIVIEDPDGDGSFAQYLTPSTVHQRHSFNCTKRLFEHFTGRKVFHPKQPQAKRFKPDPDEQKPTWHPVPEQEQEQFLLFDSLGEVTGPGIPGLVSPVRRPLSERRNAPDSAEKIAHVIQEVEADHKRRTLFPRENPNRRLVLAPDFVAL